METLTNIIHEPISLYSVFLVALGYVIGTWIRHFLKPKTTTVSARDLRMAFDAANDKTKK